MLCSTSWRSLKRIYGLRSDSVSLDCLCQTDCAANRKSARLTEGPFISRAVVISRGLGRLSKDHQSRRTAEPTTTATATAAWTAPSTCAQYIDFSHWRRNERRWISLIAHRFISQPTSLAGSSRAVCSVPLKSAPKKRTMYVGRLMARNVCSVARIQKIQKNLSLIAALRQDPDNLLMHLWSLTAFYACFHLCSLVRIKRSSKTL